MMNAYDLRFAGIHIRILAPRPLCLPENLTAFWRDDLVAHEPDWLIEVIFGTEQACYSDSDSVKIFPRKDGECFIRVIPADRNHTCRLFVPQSLADKFCVNANWVLFLMPERLLLPYQRIMLHASAVIHDGCAILFTAPSGTGKSTQANLWVEHLGAEIINGDKVILSADGNRPVAYGGPVAGTSRIFRDLWAPVRAIVYLHQGKTNHAERLDRRHAFMALYSQAIKSADDPDFNSDLLPLLTNVTECVPVLDYACLPDASAVEYLLDKLGEFDIASDGCPLI